MRSTEKALRLEKLIELELRGAGARGELVNMWRTFLIHSVVGGHWRDLSETVTQSACLGQAGGHAATPKCVHWQDIYEVELTTLGLGLEMWIRKRDDWRMATWTNKEPGYLLCPNNRFRKLGIHKAGRFGDESWGKMDLRKDDLKYRL